MSLHSSLRSRVGGRHRNVLKRYERVKRLTAEEKWSPEDSPYGLPKVRSIKVRVKKEKAPAAVKAAEGEVAAGETPETSGKAPEGAKKGADAPKKKESKS